MWLQIVWWEEKVGSKAKMFETSDTVDQRTRQQYTQGQVIDISRSLAVL